MKKSIMNHRNFVILMMTLLFVSCYKIGKVYSPKSVAPNTAYEGRIVIVNDNNNGPQTGYSLFAICVPKNWDVTMGPGALQQYAREGVKTEGWDANVNLDMVYSPNYSAICNSACPREGYEWIGFRSAKIYRRSLQGSASNGCDSIAFNYQVLNDGLAGDYHIDYIVGNIESNEENPSVIESWSGNPLNSDLFTCSSFGVEGTDFKKVNTDAHSLVTVLEGGTPVEHTPAVSVSAQQIQVEGVIEVAFENVPKNALIQTYKYNALVPMNKTYVVTSSVDQRYYEGNFSMEGFEPGVYHVRALRADGSVIEGAEASFTVGDYEAADATLGKVMVMGAPAVLAPELIVNKGTALTLANGLSANLYSISGDILDAQVMKIIDAKPEAVFVVGNLTSNGARVSHEVLVAKLNTLRDAGINVFVVPGAADVNNPAAASYDGDETIPAETVTADEFAALYTDFGYGKAVSRDERTLSYMTYVNSNIALVALDGCEYDPEGLTTITTGHLEPSTCSWLIAACTEAESTGHRIVAMASHLVSAPFNGYNTLGTVMNNNDAVDITSFIGAGAGESGEAAPAYEYGNDEIQKIIGSAGISAVFTAGVNASDNQLVIVDEDTHFYQINTAAATAYECPLRTVSFSENGIDISTSVMKDFPTSDGQSFEDYAYDATFHTLPVIVEQGIIESWPVIDAFLQDHFTFEINEDAEIELFKDMNVFFKLPETGEEMAAIVNKTIVPPLIKLVTTFAQGNEDKRTSQALLEEFHAGVDGLFAGLVSPDWIAFKDLVIGNIKDGFVSAGLDIDAMVDRIVGSIVFNYLGDVDNVTNDLYAVLPYSTSRASDGISNVSATANTGAPYNISGQRVSNNYKGIVIRDNKKIMQR